MIDTNIHPKGELSLVGTGSAQGTTPTAPVRVARLLFKTYGNVLIAVKTTAHRTQSSVCGPSQARYRFMEACDRLEMAPPVV